MKEARDARDAKHEAQGTRALGRPEYSRGDRVRVLKVDAPGHIRTPYYVRGLEGDIERFVGYFRNPEELAYGRYHGEKRALYRVRFLQTDIWPDYTGPRQDTLDVEIYDGVSFSGGIPSMGTQVFQLSSGGSSMQVQSHGLNSLDVSSYDIVVGLAPATSWTKTGMKKMPQ